MRKLLMGMMIGFLLLLIPSTAEAATAAETAVLYQQTQAQVAALQGVVNQFENVTLTDPNQVTALNTIKTQLAQLKQQETLLAQMVAAQGATTATATATTAVAQTAVTQTATPTAGVSYVGNSNSKKFHKTTCQFAARTAEKNRVYINSREEAINAGFVPCKVCNP